MKKIFANVLQRFLKGIVDVVISIVVGLIEFVSCFAIIMGTVFLVPYLANYGAIGIFAIFVYVILVPLIILLLYKKIGSRSRRRINDS